MKNYKQPVFIVLVAFLIAGLSTMNGNCSDNGALEIPRISKLSVIQLDSLFGKPKIYSESESKKGYSYQINEGGVSTATFYFTTYADSSVKMKSMEIGFEKPIIGIKKVLRLLSMRTDIAPDVDAPGVYRWEEKTKLHGFYSVQLVKTRDKKIEFVVIVIRNI